MIKRADASSIKREKATKEQIAENFKRLATDSTKKVELKPSILKTVKSLDGKTFGIIHENKTYYLKYTVKKGTNNPVDFKHLDSLNSSFGIEKHNSFEKAVNKMNFICEAQNNAHKLRLLNEAEDDIIDDTEEKTKSDEEGPVSSDDLETKLFNKIEAEKETSAETPAADMGADMGGELPPADMPPADMGTAPAEEEPIDTTKTGGAEPQEIATDILGNLDKEKTPDEVPDAEGEEEKDLNDEIQSKLGETQELIGNLKKDETKYDSSFIKTTINSLLGYWGDALKELNSDDVKDIKDRLEGSQVDEKPSDEKTETPPVEDVPAEAQLDENFLRQLKAESKRLLKEQLEQEIIKRKRSILIEGIKRKLR
jgi:hypothetical protein